MKIYEAFVPNGNSKTEVHSVGLFIGDLGNIRKWVASHSQYWEGEPQPDTISITERIVQDVDSEARRQLGKRQRLLAFPFTTRNRVQSFVTR